MDSKLDDSIKRINDLLKEQPTQENLYHLALNTLRALEAIRDILKDGVQRP